MARTLTALTRGRRVLLAGLVCAVVAWIAGPAGRLPLAMALLGLAPGYLLERALPLARPHLLARSALWLGLSLSLVALLYQWLWPLGLSLGGPVLALLASALGMATLALAWVDLGAPRAAASRAADQRPAAGTTLSVWLLLGLVTALTCWTRFEHIRDLALPAWVDPVHHALLVRIAAETGRAPVSLEPYMPVRDLPYHWGYHVFIASLMRLSGLALPEALLWSGQILNALHAPMAGALALTVWRRPTAAVGAALVAGLISTMPAYYVSWGRYTQLSGLLLLAGLAVAWERGLAGGGRGWWALLGVQLAGLSLIHVRVLAFALALLAAWGLVWAAGASRAALGARASGALAASFGALALTAPWLLLLGRRAILPAVARPASLVLEGGYDALNLAILWVGYNQLLAALAMLAVLWGMWRRAPGAAVLLIWVGLLLLLANPRLLGYLLPALSLPLIVAGLLGRRPLLIVAGALALAAAPWLLRAPSTWLLNNDAVVISLFLPFSVAIGGGAALLYATLQAAPLAALRRAAAPLAIMLTVASALWGASNLRSVLNPTTVVATAADRAAVAWVAANTPPEARFLINASPWLGIARRGSDGGWWLLPLAGRWTSTPPVLFTYGSPAYVQETIARGEAIAAYQPGQEQAILDLMRRDGIDYLYFGVEPGTLRPEAFAALPELTTVYSHDGVTILARRSQS